MGEKTLTAGELLDGHAALDVQCLDRIYLNAYVPILQTSSQVVAFLSGHLGFPFASPALFNKLGQRFRKAVADYAKTHGIPWINFGKGDDNSSRRASQPQLVAFPEAFLPAWPAWVDEVPPRLVPTHAERLVWGMGEPCSRARSSARPHPEVILGRCTVTWVPPRLLFCPEAASGSPIRPLARLGQLTASPGIARP